MQFSASWLLTPVSVVAIPWWLSSFLLCVQQAVFFFSASCSALFSSASCSASSFLSSAAASHSTCSLRSLGAVSRILRHSSIRNLLLDFSSKPKDFSCFFNSSKASETNVVMMIVNQQIIPGRTPRCRDR